MAHLGEAYVFERARRNARARDRVDQVVYSHATPLWRLQLRNDLRRKHPGASVPVVVAADLRVTRPSARHRVGVRALWRNPKQDDTGSKKQPKHHPFWFQTWRL